MTARGCCGLACTAAGYRLYGEEAVERLGLISTAKHLGLPLEDIGDLLAVWETGTCAQVKADLESRITARLAQAAQRAAQIKAFTAALRAALERVQRSRTGLAAAAPAAAPALIVEGAAAGAAR